MATLTISDLDPAIEQQLRIRAAKHGHSVEAEARQILRLNLTLPERRSGLDLYDRIRGRFEALGDTPDLVLPPRDPAREPPRFD